MPIDWLVLLAALTSGLLGGLHHLAISVDPVRWSHLKAKLDDAKLTGAKLFGADLRESQMEWAVLDNVQHDQQTRWGAIRPGMPYGGRVED